MWGQIGMALAQTAMQYKGAKDGQKFQDQMVGNANTALDTGRENALGYSQPFMGAGQDAIGQLVAMLNGDTSWMDNGALGVVQDQAAERVEKSQAARGRTGAGETTGMIARAMAEPALNYEQNRISNLQNLFNTGANVAGNMGNIESQTAANKANVFMGQNNLAGKKSEALGDGIGQLAGIMSNSARGGVV